MKKMRNVLVTVKNFLRSLEEFKQGKVKKKSKQNVFFNLPIPADFSDLIHLEIRIQIRKLIGIKRLK